MQCLPTTVTRTVSTNRELLLRSDNCRLLLQAVVLLPTIRLGLRVIGLQQVQTVLRRLLPTTQRRVERSKSPTPARVTEAARLVEMASRHTVLANTCLHRSLALWWLLGRRGFDCSLRVGVRKDGGHFNAHAWVEYRGAVLNDHPAVGQDYVPLTSFPAKSVHFVS